MGFELVRRRGKYWDDCKQLHRFLKKYPFHTTGKNERDFENGLASFLLGMEISSKEKPFNAPVISQIDKKTKVQSVYCFGKNHRPDIAFGENGIAIEMKFVTYAGLKEAIGQGFLYRLRYKFVFLVLIISESRSVIYDDLHENKEKDLHDTLKYLAKTMNIFTYVVPAFEVKLGKKKCISYFE